MPHKMVARSPHCKMRITIYCPDVQGFLENPKGFLPSYVYDPAIGDPDRGITPGTPFENLPDDWTCVGISECAPINISLISSSPSATTVIYTPIYRVYCRG
jgi:hypothetical protein